jgi:hypothetical protein
MGALPTQPAGVNGLTRRQFGLGCGERDRAVGMALTIQTVANHSR